MDYDGRVVFKIDGDDSGLQKTINNTTNALGGLKSTLVKLGIGAVLAKTFHDGVKNTNEFEHSLAKASTLFGDVEVDTENLSKKIIELSSATGQAASSIGNSLYNALSAGVEVTEDMGTAMDFLESATKLSVAGFTDVDTAVTATAKVMNAYGKEMYDAERIGEILMQTQNLGITTVDQLGSALATVTPIAASFGVSFEQVGASLALMTKQGTDTATATTQLRGIIAELGQDGTQASKNLQKAFERTGSEYKSFAEYMKNPENNLQGAIKLLEEEAENAGLTLSDMFGNVRAGVGALQLAKDETGLYTDFLDNLKGETNLVEDAYAKMMDTRTNKLAKMKEQLKNIAIKITGSETASGILDGLVDLGQKFLDKIDEWADGIDSFGHRAKLVFKYIEGVFDRAQFELDIDLGEDWENFKKALKTGDWDKILETGGTLIKDGIKIVAEVTRTAWDAFKTSITDFFGASADGNILQKTLHFSIKLVDDMLTPIFDKIKSGNILGGIAEATGDFLLIKFSFKAIEGAMTSLFANFTAGKSFGGVGVWTADALMLYAKFSDAMTTGDWAKFAEGVGISLVAAMGALLVTSNPLVSGLVFGITLKLTDLMVSDDLQPVIDAFADPDKSFGDKLTSVLDYAGTKFAGLASIIGKITGLGGNEKANFKDALWRRDYIKENNLPNNLDVSSLKKIYTLSTAYKKDAHDVWMNMGEYINKGLEDGLLKWNPEKRICELADKINEAFEEAEEIHSPSKVWEIYGEYLAEGIAMGLTGAKAEAYAKDAVKKLREMLEEEVYSGDVGLWEEKGGMEASKFLDTAASNMSTSINNANQKPQTDGGGGGGGTTDPEPPQPPDPNGWQKFWTTMKNGADTTIPLWDELGNGLFNLSEGMYTVEDGVVTLTEKGQLWADMMNTGLTTMLASFETFGEDLVAGKASWKSFARAGLEALASILEALGYQLASMAISTYPNFAQMALSAAGSALAFTGAGLVRGYAGKFERGGIVGGSGITGDRHMIFANAGELILSKAQQGAIASQLGGHSSGGSINITFSGQVFGDEASISEYVYNGIRTAQREGVIGSW